MLLHHRKRLNDQGIGVQFLAGRLHHGTKHYPPSGVDGWCADLDPNPLPHTLLPYDN
jgi:hypothetical protein